jgi:SM-20-related protein
MDHEPLVRALAAEGCAAVANFLAPGELAALAALLRERVAAGRLRPAAIGAGAARQVRPSVRGDEIEWLEESGEAAERALLERFAQLRLVLNRELMLGLVDFECHYARYAPGARYARHLDRSARGAERVVSLILYLNEGWQPDDGGALVVYGAPTREIAPVGGTLVAFLSERFEHEVRPATRERLSVTGWFRRRGLSSPAP